MATGNMFTKSSRTVITVLTVGVLTWGLTGCGDKGAQVDDTASSAVSVESWKSSEPNENGLPDVSEKEFGRYIAPETREEPLSDEEIEHFSEIVYGVDSEAELNPGSAQVSFNPTYKEFDEKRIGEFVGAFKKDGFDFLEKRFEDPDSGDFIVGAKDGYSVEIRDVEDGLAVIKIMGVENDG